VCVVFIMLKPKHDDAGKEQKPVRMVM
jgi:hypothetical protein